MKDAASETVLESGRVAVLQRDLASVLAQVASLTQERDSLTQERDSLIQERDQLRAAHARLLQELELLKRRLFIAKAERVDTAQLELEFAAKLRALEELAGTLGLATGDDPEAPEGGDDDGPKRRKRSGKPTGRRNVRTLNLPEERIEILDPVLEALVEEGKARRAGFEESSKLGHKRGGTVCVVVARAKYQTVDREGQTAIETTEMPPETLPRLLATPSLLAHVVVDKFADGLPLHRIEARFARDGVPVDRGTMCRWVEQVGATLGATVVTAARREAFASAKCIATDATGVLIQPGPSKDKARRACRKGHFFVHVADHDHVFLEYTPRETSDAVAEMFRGFSGVIQADAKSVYDRLFAPKSKSSKSPVDGETPAPAAPVPTELGCWAHARRKFWEAGCCTKDHRAREGLARIARIFALDASWQKQAPAEIKRLRDAHLRPHADAFFAWSEAEYERVRAERGPLRTAFGYAVRQKAPLLRVFDDGRLVLDNNRSERNLRPVAVGRKAWLFFGSDDHAESASNLFSLIASARLHSLDPEAYLRDVLRVLAHWPKDRFLELAPKYWARTRQRLAPEQLADEVGPLTVPPPEEHRPPDRGG